MIREYLKQDKYITRKDYTENREDFAGAYVKDPVPGMYEWVSCFDYASLYPSLIRQFYISPENYIGIKEKTDKINNVITTITKVADQTNL